MMRTLFLQAPSFDGFDGGAGSRYQARREIQSLWYPTWPAQPPALAQRARPSAAPPPPAPRRPARRGGRALWDPPGLAQPAALVEGSKLIDAPPHRIGLEQVVSQARDF